MGGLSAECDLVVFGELGEELDVLGVLCNERTLGDVVCVLADPVLMRECRGIGDKLVVRDTLQGIFKPGVSELVGIYQANPRYLLLRQRLGRGCLSGQAVVRDVGLEGVV